MPMSYRHLLESVVRRMAYPRAQANPIAVRDTSSTMEPTTFFTLFGQDVRRRHEALLYWKSAIDTLSISQNVTPVQKGFRTIAGHPDREVADSLEGLVAERGLHLLGALKGSVR